MMIKLYTGKDDKEAYRRIEQRKKDEGFKKSLKLDVNYESPYLE